MKEYEMTSNLRTGDRILGSLRSADGVGVVRIEDRFDTGIDELWSALTDTQCLARWYGEGELRAGGGFRARLHASGWEGTGRVEECEPPRRFRVVSKAPDEPNEDSTEVTLTGHGDQTTLVVEQRGLPLDLLWAYGAGLQIHVEDLAAHIAGRERGETKMRFAELEPAYRDLAAKVDSATRAGSP
jgi:uncharacterized protein YndB with AHSA1/START domain